MTNLLIWTLATLGSWDILRRLLPVRLPVVIGKIICLGIAWVLIVKAPSSAVEALSVPGGLMLLSIILQPEPNQPWGSHVSEFLALIRSRRQASPGKQAQSPPRVGNRVPKL